MIPDGRHGQYRFQARMETEAETQWVKPQGVQGMIMKVVSKMKDEYTQW